MVLTRISLVIPLGMINVMQGTAQRLALLVWRENQLAKRKNAFVQNQPQKAERTAKSSARFVGQVLSFVESTRKEISFSPTVSSSQLRLAS
jgi:hypothetical protein